MCPRSDALASRDQDLCCYGGLLRGTTAEHGTTKKHNGQTVGGFPMTSTSVASQTLICSLPGRATKSKINNSVHCTNRKTRLSFGVDSSSSLVVETSDGSRGPVTPFWSFPPFCVTHGHHSMRSISTSQKKLTGRARKNTTARVVAPKDANGRRPAIRIRCDPMQRDCNLKQTNN
jgi:hypothetical protein